MREDFTHVPVLLEEVLEAFAGCDDGVLIDATIGGGGHSAALLAAHPNLELIGFDRDPAAIAAAGERLAEFGDRVVLHRARFDGLAAIVRATLGERRVVAILFDLGVSSHQLDVAERGFSYRNDGPLDMRMDPDSPVTAAELVNSTDEDALARLFAANGEDRFARRIARSIVAHRPIETTSRLADVVSDAIPAAARRRGHPARRVFQALRIAVNEELDVLAPALDDAIALLAPGGRMIVLAYHSGEDRLVKARLDEAATGGCVCPPGLPCVCGAEPLVRLLKRGARMASAEEIERNPRAEAVRMRVAVRLDADDRGRNE